MPEGPECRLIAEELKSIYLGMRLVEATMTRDVIGLTLTDVGSKGKLLWMEFDDGKMCMMITLGMTGMFTFDKTSVTRESFVFEDSPILYYNDKRRLGSFVVGDRAYKQRRMDVIGMCIFDPELTSKYYIKRLRRCQARKLLKDALLDQHIIGGVGNYIRSEVLYRSGIHRDIKVIELNLEQLANLLCAIKFVSKESYEAGGASIDYVHLDGTKGSFLSKCHVYGREFDPTGKKVHKTDETRKIHYVDE